MTPATLTVSLGEAGLEGERGGRGSTLRRDWAGEARGVGREKWEGFQTEA